MTQAEKHIKDKPKELTSAASDIVKASKASQSLAQINFRHEDGSTTVVSSFAGDEAKVTALPADADDDALALHVEPGEAIPEEERDDFVPVEEVTSGN